MTTPTPDSKAPEGNDKLIILGCYLSIFLCVGLLYSLVVFLVRKDNPVAAHAKETLNFFITLFIAMVVLSVISTVLSMMVPILGLLVYFAMLAVLLGAIVLCVMGAMKASEGTVYSFPINLRLIK